MSLLNSLALSLLFVGIGTSATNVSYTWLDASLPTETRLQSFLSQLNVSQKLNMTQGNVAVRPCVIHSMTTQLTRLYSLKPMGASDMYPGMRQ
jgi:hypothetical protein